MRPSPALLALVLAGCVHPDGDREDGLPGDIESGWIDTCLRGPEGEWSTWREPGGVLVGTVAGLAMPGRGFDDHPCREPYTTAVEIVDDEGESWFLGWTLTDATDTDVTPPFDLFEGQPVQLEHRWLGGFSVMTGFVLQDDAGLVAAVDVNGMLEEGDVPGLEVGVGEVSARVRGLCGRVEEHVLVFDGDDTVAVEPFGVAPLTVGGEQLTAVAVAASWIVGPTDCLDASGARAWAVYR